MSSLLPSFARTDVAGMRAPRHGVCPLLNTERPGQRDVAAGHAGVAAAELVLPADAVQALDRIGTGFWSRYGVREGMNNSALARHFRGSHQPQGWSSENPALLVFNGLRWLAPRLCGDDDS